MHVAPCDWPWDPAVAVQSDLLSCLASLRAFPAILTLFLMRSCSDLLPMFCPGNAVPLVNVSYIGLIWGLSTAHNIYLSGTQTRESLYLHQTPVSREKRGIEGLPYELLRIKSFSYYLSFPPSIPFSSFLFLFWLNFKTFISHCSWVNEPRADFPLKIKVEERREEKKCVARSVLVIFNQPGVFMLGKKRVRWNNRVMIFFWLVFSVLDVENLKGM